MSSQGDLFRMNEHGDIWQEPSLFDAPQEPLEQSAESAAFLAEHRAHVAENLELELDSWEELAGPFCERCGVGRDSHVELERAQGDDWHAFKWARADLERIAANARALKRQWAPGGPELCRHGSDAFCTSCQPELLELPDLPRLEEIQPAPAAEEGPGVMLPYGPDPEHTVTYEPRPTAKQRWAAKRHQERAELEENQGGFWDDFV